MLKIPRTWYVVDTEGTLFECFRMENNSSPGRDFIYLRPNSFGDLIADLYVDENSSIFNDLDVAVEAASKILQKKLDIIIENKDAVFDKLNKLKKLG